MSKPKLPLLAAICAAALVACSFNARAANITNTAGKIYFNVEFVRRDPDSLTLRHDGGLSKVYFWEVSKAVQDRYGYGKQGTRQYYKQSQQEEFSAYRHQQELARHTREQRKYEEAHQELAKTLTKAAFEIVGEVSKITEEGALIIDAKRPYRHKEKIIRRGYTSMKSNRRFRTVTEYESITAEFEPVLVIGAGSGFHDGQGWKGTVYRCGTYQYTTVMGSTKTVQCFALTPKAAVQKLLGDSSNRTFRSSPTP